jgi:hypothetical protein
MNQVKAIATRDSSGNYVPTSATNPVPVALYATAAASLTLATIGQGYKLVAAAGTPERLVAAAATAGAFGKKFLVKANKNAGADNTGLVLLGTASGAGNQHIVLVPSEGLELEAAPGEYLDLYYWYLDAATNGDGISWVKLG